MHQIDNIDDIVKKIPVTLLTYGSLFKVANKIQAVGDRVMGDLTMRQQFLLVTLSLFEDYAPTLQELSFVFGSSYQNVKRMANLLEEKGYLTIYKDLIDRRKLRILLNREKFGADATDSMTLTNDFLAQLYEGMEESEIEVLSNLLNRLDSNLERMAGL